MNGVRGSAAGGRRKTGGPPPPPVKNKSKERDEDLLLFRELHDRRGKDRVVSLLQPVSDEFEPTGNYALYRMASAKKGPTLEFLAENEKNDYDWLKTPPATPLFPSLEMETNAPGMVVHRELPIIQTLSRFGGNSEAAKKPSSTIGTLKPSPSPKPKAPFRSITPVRKPITNPPTDQKKNSKSAPIFLNQKQSTTIDPFTKPNGASAATTTIIKSAVSNQRESQLTVLASNLSKSTGGLDSPKAKPTSTRGLSPQVIRYVNKTAEVLGVSDETPPNLKTDRSSSALRRQSDRSGSALRDRAVRSGSALRGRSETQNQNQSHLVGVQPATKSVNRRQSCSPSVTRGRKVVSSSSSDDNTVTTPRGKIQTSGNAGQVFGSRMVDKFLSARKTSAEERSDTKPRLYGSINESSGFGRLMAKSSLDVAVKHMQDDKPEAANFRQKATGRRTTNSINSLASNTKSGSNRQQYA